MYLAGLNPGDPTMEIRIHGREGQGNVVAAYILAQAAFECGKFGQALPSSGPEQRGGPVTAFVRITDVPIGPDCQVTNPAFVILQDHALMHAPGVTDGLLPRGGVLVNWAKPVGSITTSNGQRVLAVPASALALDILGKPVPNTALLAALVTLTGLMPLDALEQALALRFRDETLARNVRLMRAAAKTVPAGLWKEIAHAPGA
jgi:pyruvate ferredoxin oxidoreductase gamma subunit